jgi:hypothetical protein
MTKRQIENLLDADKNIKKRKKIKFIDFYAECVEKSLWDEANAILQEVRS